MPRRQVGTWAYATLTAALLLAAGCDSRGNKSDAPEGQMQATPAGAAGPATAPTESERGAHASVEPAAPPPAATNAAAPIVLRVADRQLYEDVLARHKGKPVLVDFWATWCVSCTEQFPRTVELHAKYAAKGLAVVAVSLDEPGDKPKVKAFLEKQGATFDNLLSQWGSDDPSFEHFDIRAGTIPHYKLYDRDGRLVETFSVDPSAAKQFTPADIEQRVVRLLPPHSP